jgi:hypothetical protein
MADKFCSVKVPSEDFKYFSDIWKSILTWIQMPNFYLRSQTLTILMYICFGIIYIFFSWEKGEELYRIHFYIYAMRIPERIECVQFHENESSRMPVADTCNPNYSGGRDQEYRSSKSPQENSSRDLILKILNTKWAGGVA